MKKQTAYYVIGAVLVGTGIYLYTSKKSKEKEVSVNLNPPMEVTEVANEVVTTTENTVFTALDKLKALIDSIKSKKASTPAIN